MSSALDESTNKSQSAHQSVEDNEGFFTVFMKALNSDSSQGTGLGRNAEEDKLVSYLEQTNKFLSDIIKVSLVFGTRNPEDMNFNTHQSHNYLPLPPIFVLKWGYYSWVMSESRTFPLWKQRLMGHWLLLQDAILFYLFLGPRFTRWCHSKQNHSMGEQLACLGKQAVVIN